MAVKMQLKAALDAAIYRYSSANSEECLNGPYTNLIISHAWVHEQDMSVQEQRLSCFDNVFGCTVIDTRNVSDIIADVMQTLLDLHGE